MIKPTEIKNNMDAMVLLFKEAENDSDKLKRLIEDPLQELESLGISVDEEFREPVAKNMSATARVLKPLDIPTKVPPKAPRLSTIEVKSATKAAQKEPDFQFYPNNFGLVLKVNKGGMTKIKSSADIAAGIGGAAAAIGALAAESGIGIAVTVIAALYTAAVVGHSNLIIITDEGKGVYLTYLWAFIGTAVPLSLFTAGLAALAVASLPIITPIK